MNIRTETWLGHEIRFVEVIPNDWQGIANDVTNALGLKNSRRAIASLPEDQKGVTTMNTLVDFIKANKIANKAVSNIFGYPKSIKKGDMTPDMLVPRQEILDETVNLMAIKEKFSMDISVSKTVYGRYH